MVSNIWDLQDEEYPQRVLPLPFPSTRQPGTLKKTVASQRNALKVDQLFPGQRVSVDHFNASVSGRCLKTYGKEPENQRYVGGAIFVDHSSGYIHVVLQLHLNSHETLKAKKEFKRMCHDYGVVIETYVSDNGRAFRNAEFEASLKEFHQQLRYAAVGAHHSNGIAERAISTTMSLARATMHHAALHWPDISDTALWPLAVLHAVHIINNVPRPDNGRSPEEIFTRKVKPASKLQELHVWGCPVYMLDKTIADGNKIPRWRPRSARCMYMVVSCPTIHGNAVAINGLSNHETLWQKFLLDSHWDP